MITGVLLTLPPSAVALQPPRPGEIDSLKAAGTFDARLADAQAIGNDEVDPVLISIAEMKLARTRLLGSADSLFAESFPYPTSVPSTGIVKTFVLLIDFPNSTPTQPAYPSTFTTSQIDARVFGSPATGMPNDSLHNFYDRSSYGTLDIKGTTYGWYHSPRTRDQVAPITTGDNYVAEQGLIKEAIMAMDAQGVDFSQYDNNGDGEIDYFNVVWTGPAGAWSSFWWGHQWSYFLDSYKVDGKSLGDYTWQWEKSSSRQTDFNPDTVIHETGHALGLPDYYDYDPEVGPGGGVGGADCMHLYMDHNAFSKYLLGWVTPKVIASGEATITLRESATTTDAVIVMPDASIAAPFKEYYVVQNRQNAGNDIGGQVFPWGTNRGGLMIWHVDARGSGGFAWNNSYTSHKLLRLMEADGEEMIETEGWADEGDLYRPGASFDTTSRPTSRDYAGAQTGVFVHDIVEAGKVITARIGIGKRCDVMKLNSDATWTATTTVSLSSEVPWAGQMRVDSGAGWEPWKAYAATSTASLVGVDGTRTVLAEYRVNSGSTTSSVLSDSILLDRIAPSAPVITSTSHPNESTWYATRNVDADWSATDALSAPKYGYAFDVSPTTVPSYATFVQGLTYSNMPDGVRYVHVRACDLAGNWGPTTHRAVRIDATAPTGTAALARASVNSTVAVSLVASDVSPLQMQFSVTGSSLTAYEPFASTRVLTLAAPDGTKTVDVRVKDAAGNTATFAAGKVLLDTKVPTTTCDAISAYTTTATISLTATDSGSGVSATYYGVDASPTALYSASVKVGTVGAHVLYYFSRDAAGNTEPVRQTSFIVDPNTPATPVVVSADHPDQATWHNKSTAQLTFSAVNATTYRSLLDQSAVSVPSAATPSATASLTTSLVSGDNWFHVQGINSLGTAGPTAHYRLRCDMTPPAGTIEIAGAGSGIAYSTAQSVSAKAILTDTQSGLGTMQFDPGSGLFDSPRAYSASATVTFTAADGTRTVGARYLDAAGNAIETTRVVVLDQVAPETTSTARSSYVGQASISLAAADAVSGVAKTEYKLDAGSWVTYTAPVEVSGVATYTLTFRSKDKAGNQEVDRQVTFAVVRVPQEVRRVDGATRYDVSANLARKGWDPANDLSWPGVTHLIVASGEDRASADPLAAAGLAGIYDAPVLLVRSDPNQPLPYGTLKVIAEIGAKRPVQVHIVGGRGSVPDKTWQRIRAISGVVQTEDRLDGATRYDVSANIARRMVAVEGIDQIPGVLIVCAQNPAAFYDALVASPAAYRQHMPMIGVRTSYLEPAATKVLAEKFSGVPLYVVSSSTYISEGVKLAMGATEPRLTTSSSRYVAARQISDTAIGKGWLSAADTGVAAKLPDALTGGAFIGRRKGVLLFTDSGTSLRVEPRGFVTAREAQIDYGWVFGGTGSVPTGTETNFRQLLQ